MRTGLRGCGARSILGLLAVAVLALVLETASVPHGHLGVNAGLWNQEHDLATLAALGSGAPLPDRAAAPPFVLVASAPRPAPAAVPAPAPRAHADPRAPPVTA
jgi:hypothetical protein